MFSCGEKLVLSDVDKGVVLISKGHYDYNLHKPEGDNRTGTLVALQKFLEKSYCLPEGELNPRAVYEKLVDVAFFVCTESELKQVSQRLLRYERATDLDGLAREYVSAISLCPISRFDGGLRVSDTPVI